TKPAPHGKPSRNVSERRVKSTQFRRRSVRDNAIIRAPALMSSPAAAIDLGPASSTRSNYTPLILFSCGHFFVDLYSIALSVMQPLLLVQFGLTLTQAGVLGGLLVFSSSVMQPVYGYLADRFHTRLFSALGPGVAAIFISSLGLASNYSMLLAMVWLGGAGIAAFHPQAAANAPHGILPRPPPPPALPFLS